MVRVKLRTRRTANSRICTFRNTIVAAMTVLSVHFIFLSDQSDDGIVKKHNAGSRPVGVEQMLQGSKGRAPRKHGKPPSRLRSPDQDEHAADFNPGASPDEKSDYIPENPNSESSKTSIVIEKKGTGPTNVAYVKDFVDEREHPAVRMAKENSEDSSKIVSSLMNEASVKPCLVYQGGKNSFDSKCTYPDTTLIAYNSAWFDRTWCGQEIKPGTAVAMTEHCADEIVHLSAIDPPPLSGQGMEPVIIRSHNEGTVDVSDQETVECNIQCMQEKGMQGSQRFVDGEPWSITYTDDDAFSNSHAILERLAYRRDHFYSTQSFMSAVPHTFFEWSKYNPRDRPAVDWATAKNKAVYLVNSRCTSPNSRRHRYFGAVAEVLPVDSYGSCGHNTDLSDGMTLETSEGRIQIMKQYRIVLAFDAGTDKDHISPMIWDALISGAVPVLVGAENMRSHLPSGSFVWSGDFRTWNDMAIHVKEVLENKTLWDSYQTWRTNETVLSQFEAKYSFAEISPMCRLCRWAYAKKHGLGWNHEKQVVSEPTALRKLCTSQSKGLISKPFEEVWLSRLDQDDNIWQADQDTDEECNSMTTDSMIESDDFKIHRVAAMHHGVTDIIVKDLDRDDENRQIVLRLTFGVENLDGVYFRNTHALMPTSRLQAVSSASILDERVKVTVISDWVTDISSPREGAVEIVIQKSSEAPTGKDISKRVRIIHEDYDAKNDKMTEFYPSVFCKKMIKDFVDPLELFYTDS
jgi:hypothetical protein